MATEKPETLVDRLRGAVQRGADAPLYTFLLDGDADAASLTRGELDARARAVGAQLAERGLAGRRVLLLYPPGPDFFVALFGCLYAGAVAVPAYPPDPSRLARALPRLQAVVADSVPTLVLTTSALLAMAEGVFELAPELRGVAWAASDAWAELAPGDWAPRAPSPDDLAFIQYTSGSTSQPKGVLIGHDNLAANLAQLAHAYRSDERSVTVGWLPFYHDMGLIGMILLPAFVGGRSVLMSPVDFLKRPRRWLASIDRHRASHTAAPNFALDLCARRLTRDDVATLDLSCLTTLVVGAEPTRRETLERFHALLAPAGLRAGAVVQGYGLAEAVLASVVGSVDEPCRAAAFDAASLAAGRAVVARPEAPFARWLVSCGAPLAGQRVVVVDPTSRVQRPDGELGELWVAGPNVARGYWGRPEESERTFGAFVADGGDGPFLRTGDLGFRHGGEFFIAGRLKDLIIVGGRNHYPQDIEHTVARCHPHLRAGGVAAFALDGGDEERVAVVAEVDLRALPRGEGRAAALDEIVLAVRDAVVREHELAAHTVVLIEPGQLPKTSSGKVMRRACRDELAAGSLAEVSRSVLAGSPRPDAAPPALSRTAADLAAKLTSRLAACCGLPVRAIKPELPFAQLGLDSRTAVGLVGELEAELGRPLPATLFYDHPCVAALTRFLAEDVPPPASPAPARPEAHAAEDGIAVVGMGCRLPGGVEDPEGLWRLLAAGVDAVTEVPADRWDARALYDPDPDAPGSIYSRWGGFIRDIERFEPAFFGISPREAPSVDPQQRMLLEVAWEALERAGITPEELLGSPTGVYVGLSGNDYQQRALATPHAIDAYALLGTAHSASVGRLSYWLGLQGPNLAVDTACSSSLVAVHLACAALRDGECALAIAGGANLVLSPEGSIYFSRLKALSPTGRCRAFSADADGYVRSEGCGVVVLKRLRDALRDGDPVLAVIRGSAVNQDGRSNGLTAPSGAAQRLVLRQALDRAGVAPAGVDYVECHGTGTALGDPIEVQAVAEVYREGRAAESPLLLGAAKGNVGHTEAAAGVVGLIKAVLCLQHGAVPGALHCDRLNPHVPWPSLPVRVPTALTPWAPGARVRRAGVSAFGFSGTNAHLVLEEAPRREDPAPTPARAAELVVLSARSEAALAAQAARLRAHVEAHPEQTLGDLAFSLATTRAHFEHRLALVANSRDDLLAQLALAAEGSTAPDILRGEAEGDGRPKVVFVFPGQGSQWLGMGRSLMTEEPAFRAALEACDEAIRAEAGFSPMAELVADESESRLDRIEVVQPLLFSVAVALAAQWRTWGVEPDALVGHSMGEVAAAHVAGALSLRDAAAIVCRRSRLLDRIRGKGAMATVELSAEDARDALRGYESRLSVAVSNGPSSTVLAGEPAALAEVLAALEARGVFCRRVKVDVASHSPQVDPLRDDLLAALASVAPRETTVPMRSTVTGGPVEGRSLGPAYWVDNLRLPVRFGEAVRGLVDEGHTLFVEMSPHPLLIPAVEDVLQVAGRGGLAVASLRRGRPEHASMLAALGALWTRGHAVDWRRRFPGGGRRVETPTTAWQRERHWIDRAPAPSTAAPDPVAAWVHRLDWPEMPRTRASGAAPGRWLLLADRGGTAQALAEALRARGHTCSVLPDTSDAGEVESQVACGEWRGVVDLRALDATLDADTSSREVGVAVQRATAAALCALRAVRSAAGAARLWIVTRGACAAPDGHASAPCQSALWGLGRVVSLEHPTLWGGFVDLDPTADVVEVDALAAELESPDDEDALAFRARRRLVARLTAAPEGPSPRPSLSPEGTYVVTGGLSGVGLHVARWLTACGARHLILTGRRGLETPGAEEALAGLASLGATARAAAADVADFAAMEALLDAAEPPVRGVFHCAGVGPVRPLVETNEALLAEVMRAKVEGAWGLHRLTERRPLDLFVLFSSGAALWGGAGQGAYAAANAFLDGLAHHRRERGLPALSVDWGVWADGAMGSSRDLARLDRIGVLPMPTAECLDALGRLLRGGAAQRAVARVDWPRFAPVYEVSGRRNLLAAMPRNDERPHRAPADEPTPGLRDLAASDARAALRELVHTTAAQVMGFGDPSALAADRGFAAQGMDSLMALQLRARLQRSLGVPLSSTLAFDHPTVERLTAHLAANALRLGDKAEATKAAARTSDEPVAIVGAACRLPGGVDDVDALWALLTEGGVVGAEVPPERWRASEWYDPTPGVAGRTYVTRGGFLRDIERFDAGFFGISPREAKGLDPQQRLLLEVAWEALERTGVDPASLRESPTGVFVGVGPNEYGERLDGLSADAAGLYLGTGNMPSMIAGRLSYVLGLHGPSMSVDTACSSSMVALHLGCQALSRGDCEAALVGGVNVMLSPRGFVVMSQMRALSPSGRCHTFSAEADGMARAEGCVVLVLKRLSDAQRDGDPVLALVRSTAVNHDGASSGLTVPNGPAQQLVLKQALDRAGVAPAEVDYVECHGTGTALGDPIEVQALAEVYGRGRPPERPLVLGAAKANLGHLESASGLVGVLKATLALGREAIPGQPALGALNPSIPWDALPVEVARASRPWRRGAHMRRAGVSAFGFSGTNAHVVLEEAPRREGPTPTSAPARTAELVVLSARSDAGIGAQAARLRAHVEAHPEQTLGDLAFSLATTRTPFEHRLALVANSRDALLAQLAQATAGEAPAGSVRAVTTATRGGLAMLFPGQGAQVLGMGRELHAAMPAFRAALDACAARLDRALPRPLREVMWARPGSAEAAMLEQTAFTQPALFAVGWALAAQWRAWGVEPDALAGHSVGEIAAACVAGVLSLDEACDLVAARGRLMQALPGDGAMLAAACAEGDVAALLEEAGPSVAVASVNGPRQIVLSGERRAVAALAAALASRGVRTRPLAVSHAFHSPQVEPMLAEFARVARSMTYRTPARPLIGGVTGAAWSAAECSADYWVRQARAAVRFGDAVATLHASGVRTFVEMGASATLLGLVPACLPGAEPALVPSLGRGRPEPEAMLGALGALWAHGRPFDAHALFPGNARTPLPTFAWQRQRHWVSAPAAGQRNGEATGHPLLGARVPMAAGEAVFESTLGLDALPWLAHHRVAGRALVPGAAIAELVRAAATHARHAGAAVERLVLRSPMALPDVGALRVQVVLTRDAGGAHTAAVYSQPARAESAAPWTLHATATVSTEDAVAPARADLDALRARCVDAVDVDETYARLAAAGLDYGAAFRGLRALWRGDGEAVARVAKRAEDASDGYGIHPALLDAALHSVAAVASAETSEGPWLPFEIGRFALHAGGDVAWAHARRAPGESPHDLTARVSLLDASGGVVAEVSGLRLRRAAAAAPQRDGAPAPLDALYELVWQPGAEPDGSKEAPEAAWVIVAGADSDVAARLSARLPGSVRVAPSDLRAALRTARPRARVVCLWEPDGDSPASSAHHLATQALDAAQALAEHPPLDAIWATRSAVAVQRGDDVEPAAAPVWGLGRTLRQEHPELALGLIDIGPDDDAAEALLREAGARDDEDQVAWRRGRRYVARLAKVRAGGGLPDAAEVRLEVARRGTLDALTLAPAERLAPGAGEVRIDVRAAGLNFRDVLNALGHYPGEPGALGSECAGVVAAVGADVRGLAVGDAVMALAPGALGTSVCVDARLAVLAPPGLSFAQAAATPVAFLTAWYALHDLGALAPGQRVLIHAAAGGVGLAAIQIARQIGAEVYATASPAKWGELRARGVAHLASSRTAEFAEAFRRATGGRGVDVVLDALTGELVDAGLSILRPGGRFLEMGKTDVRDPEAVARAHPGVHYRAFDLSDAGPERIAAMLAAVAAGFADGSLRPLPVRTYPIGEARDAFRFMAQARHVGKIVLVPPPRRAAVRGTVLVTGGLGALGGHVARWLAARGVAHLLLVGRRGLETPGARERVAELESLGASVTVAAADAGSPEAMRAALAALPEALPLRGVVHAAGAIDDRTLREQTAERLARVLAPKVDGAWNLHALTAGVPLDFFVMFSSLVGVLGAAGQATYAAANAFLDALAAHRRARGLAAQSLDWGAWSESGMAASLGAEHRARLAQRGVEALSPSEALALLDQALARPEAQIAPASLDLRALGASLGASVPPVWRSLVRVDVPRATGGWADRLAQMPAAQRLEEIRGAVRADAARVLSLDGPDAVPTERPLRDVGLDSLTALELRNALGQRVGKALPATLAFDHPTVEALSRALCELVAPADSPALARPVAPPDTHAAEDGIAVVGMGCRLPGGVEDPEGLWRLLAAGVDAVTEVPADRWDARALYDPDPDAPGSIYSRWGGFIRDIERFEPAFFGISPREAPSVDPQQRMLLEVAWEALERAGITPEKLLGSPTGVYVGLSGNDYQQRALATPHAIDAYALLGTAHSASVGRLSYWLGLQGPNLAVDTACSSSLVAVHLACAALRDGECALAIAGGANLVLSPEGSIYFSRLKALSPTGRCRAFSADADGYVRSEGCGVVVLKRLRDALRDGDPVLAVIRGSAVNQDGRSNGLTAPNGAAQRLVLRQALDRAGVAPAGVDYVECHGTGTALGDPIEVQAVAEVYREGRAAESPLLLGAAKGNVGHTEAAAGVVGLIKAVLCLRHGAVPGALHCDRLNPHVPWPSLPVRVPTALTPWAPGARVRRAGVSAFGFSGTNAHLVLEEAPRREGPPPAPARAAELVVMSARSESGLGAQVARLHAHVEAHPEQALGDLAFSLATTRAHFEHRLALVANSRDDLLAQLALVAEGSLGPRAVRGVASRGGTASPAAAEDTRRPLSEGALVEPEAHLVALAASWVQGEPVDLAALFPSGVKVSLPTYAWQRERHWLELPERAPTPSLPRPDHEHPLLGAATALSTQEGTLVWEGALDRRRQAWLADHQVLNARVVPGAAYVEMALAAGAESFPDGAFEVAALAFVDALVLPDQDVVRVQAVTHEGPDGGATFQVASRTSTRVRSPFRVHARGTLRRHERATPPPRLDLAETRRRLRPRGAADLYGALHAMGLQYGPAFQGVVELWCGDGEALGRVRLPAGAGSPGGYRIHPALLDACFQVTAGALDDGAERSPWLPVEIGALRRSPRPHGDLWCHARLDPADPSSPARRRADLRVVDDDGEVVVEVDGLTVQALHGAAPERAEDAWFLGVEWDRAPLPSRAPRARRWLLVGGPDGAAAALRAAQEAVGHVVEHVREPPAEATTTSPTFEAAFAKRPPTDVVHLGALDDADDLERDPTRACLGALALVHAMAASDLRQPPRLWLVTRGAQAVDGCDVRPAQCPLLGLGRVVAVEHPEFRCARVDLDPEAPSWGVAALAREVLADDAEEETAWRGDTRYAARIVPRAPTPAVHRGPDGDVRPDASYVITGAFGGLGLGVAAWLAERGAGHLVLIGRSGARSAAQRSAVATLEAKGVRVTVAEVDVAKREELAAALRGVAASGMPLRGVIHAAGVLDDGLLTALTPARFRAVFAPKVQGAANLHSLTRDAPLDFFVMYASAAGVLGSPGQGNYAAANAFLDALAHHRRASGLPALAVDWGAFSEVGMAAADGRAAARRAALGMPSLTPADGLGALARLLRGADPQVLVLPLDLPRWGESFPGAATSRRFSRLRAAGIRQGAQSEEARALRARLSSAPGAELAVLENFVQEQVGHVLRMDPARVGRDTPFLNLGVDSLMAMELRNRLQSALGVTLNATVLWSHRDVASVAQLLLDEWLQAAVMPERAPTSEEGDASEVREFEEERL